MKRRRNTNVFSLAFLDVMSCGFGAIILFFMIINADTVRRKEQVSEDLRGAVEKLQTEVTEGRDYLVELKNSLQLTEQQINETAGLSQRVIEQIRQKREELATLQNDTTARAEHINKLKADLKSLEEANKRLEGGATAAQGQGEQFVHFAGEGQRQYITGLQISGRRLVILVDSSASMLADRIVNVVRTKILPDQEKIHAAKWQQVVSTVQWISSRIPRDSQFQLMTFNERVTRVAPADTGQWLDGNNPVHLQMAIEHIRNTVPDQGTSLYHAFAAIAQMDPLPDNIFLLTDGLPTQGQSKPNRSTVDARQRVRYFNEAQRELPSGVPVNIILFPMEGDPDAASAFWLLAAQTSGAFFSPSRDWP